MKYFVLFITSMSANLALASNQNLHLDHFKIYNHDSLVFTPKRSLKTMGTQSDHSCRAQIRSKTCLVRPTRPGEENKPRECLVEKNLDTAILELEKLYDSYPNFLQKVFCSLSAIYIEKEFFGTAYAGITHDGTQAVMGIRESAIVPAENEAPISMSRWISWKEQLSWGGQRSGYPVRDDLVKVDVAMNSNGANDFLFFVVAHEFGHIIDFSNLANATTCSSDSQLCLPNPASWTELSWKSQKMDYSFPYPAEDPWGLMQWELLPDAIFQHRIELCFYACPANHGAPEKMFPLYESLQASSLLTTYSATNPWDDFAEAVAFYAGVEYADMQYMVRLPSGHVFDLTEKYKNSEIYRLKREWLEHFFAREDLRYP